MHLELVDVLRCPRPHEPSTLIATIDRLAGRSIDRGALGCPICDARFAIDEGGVVFERDQRDACRASAAAPPPSADRVLRAAALLGLAESGGVVVLGGTEGAVAAALHEQADVSVILHNPPGVVVGWEGVTPIYATALPLGPAVLRGAILDQATATAIVPVVAALRAGGRLVAPASVAVPTGVRELARDADAWVAERIIEPSAVPVALRRGAAIHSAG